MDLGIESRLSLLASAAIERKLGLLRSEGVRKVDLRKGIDLTTHSSHARVSFHDSNGQPYPQTPPYQVLDRGSLANRLGVDPASFKGPISELVDVSSSPHGVCMITASIYSVTNSHAGSHADQAYHWTENPPMQRFDLLHYSGRAVILNIAEECKTERGITMEMINDAASEVGLNLGEVSRLILRTYDKTPEKWEQNFPHLTQDAGVGLGYLPRLVMLGLDSPSVDRYDATPIIRCSHGGLWAGGVAILEGLETDGLPNERILRGVVNTRLVPIPNVTDAIPTFVDFYPN